MENYYDYAAGLWVTSDSRYEAIASQPPFDDLWEFNGSSPRHEWGLILLLLSILPDDLVSCLGCGPLENFINDHGAEFVVPIEAEARINSRFLRAVMNVNLQRGRLPAEVEARLLAAFGPRFELLDPIFPE
jgi:hypothetical protein